MPADFSTSSPTTFVMFWDTVTGKAYWIDVSGVVWDCGYTPVAGTTNDIQFNTGGDLDADTGNFVYDKVNQRIGIGIAAPVATFQIFQPMLGTGTVSNTAGSHTLSGLGTQFTNTLKAGLLIDVGGQILTVAGVLNDTTVITTGPISVLHSGVTYGINGGTIFAALGNGNIGIGTATPQVPLDINGSFRVTGYNVPTSGVGVEVLYVSGIGSVLSYDRGAAVFKELDITGSPVSIATGSGSYVTLQRSGGNVGIGTATPTSVLHVVGLGVYASNAAAVAAGLTSGAWYTDGAGNPKVVI